MNRRISPTHRIRLVFSFLLLLLLVAGIANAQGGGTIGYGSVLFGRVTAEVPQVIYSFNGTVGDLVVVKVSGYSGGLDPRVTLLGSTMQPLVANDDAAFGNGSESYLSAFLPATGPYSLLVESANGQMGDFMIELKGRGPVESDQLEMGVPVRVEIPQNPQPQYYTFEADPYCPTTLTIYDVSSGQPATFPFVVKVRDEDGVEVGMIRGGRVLENRLTVAPDGDPNPGTEMYEVEVDSADPALQGSLLLVITCAAQVPACLGNDPVGTIATPVPVFDPNGTPTMTWTPPPGDEPCVDPMMSPTPGIRLVPADTVVEIADFADETPEATPLFEDPRKDATAEATENPEHSAVVPDSVLTQQAPPVIEIVDREATDEPLEPILPEPPSIALQPTSTPTPFVAATPCPTATPTEPPCVDPTPGPRLEPIEVDEARPVLEIAPDATAAVDPGSGDEPFEALEPERPPIVIDLTSTPAPTPCPTPTQPPPGDDPCVEPTAVVLELPEIDTTVDLPPEVTGEAPADPQPLTIAAAPSTFTPTPVADGTPCPTATPTLTPTFQPSLTPTRPPTFQPNCDGFRLTSPTDGLPNGGITVYWDPIAGATSYRVNVFGEGGAPLLLSVEVAAPATSVGIDVSEGNIGPGFTFYLQVQALFNGQVNCSSGITLMRESPGGGNPGRDPDDEPEDEPDPTATFCPPTIACN